MYNILIHILVLIAPSLILDSIRKLLQFLSTVQKFTQSKLTLVWLLYHNLSCQLYQYCKIILAVTYIDIFGGQFLNQLLHAIARTRIGVGLNILPDKYNSINQFNYHIFSPNFFSSKSVSLSVMNEYFKELNYILIRTANFPNFPFSKWQTIQKQISWHIMQLKLILLQGIIFGTSVYYSFTETYMSQLTNILRIVRQE